MAGPSDKARFFLEQSATELNDLERKKIFTREEIRSIAKKRSDFEHIINARGSHPSDYMRYIEFEKNIDALRRKRIKRLGIRHKGAGQRTIYFLYNRATRKFSGDLTLWMQYIDFARKDKAYRRLNDIFTSVVRLHPTRPELWTLAAHYFMESQADITNARSYMQRGLRFCKNSEAMWLEYAKLETIYVGKIAGRRKILGLDVDRSQQQEQQENGEDADMIALPEVTAEDINPSLKQDDGIDEVALQNLASAPVLTGAIPMAIFDSAVKQFSAKAKVVEKFFHMFAEFDQLSCTRRILEHVVEVLQQNSPESVESAICAIRMQLFGCHPSDAAFPATLQTSLDLANSAMQQHAGESSRLHEALVRQLLSLQKLAAETETDTAVQKVLKATLRKSVRGLGEADGVRVTELVKALRQEGKGSEAEALVRVGSKQWSENGELQQQRLALEK